MGSVLIQEETTKNPITLIGKEAGICWGANTDDNEKNYKRGIECIQSDHGRALEFPQVYITIDGYSARVMRELYTHIGGSPTRLQESTRHIDYKDFAEKKQYIVPESINQAGLSALAIYLDTINNISKAMIELEKLNIPKEDIALLLPLGMHSKMVLRTNLRNLIDMSHQRLCHRANWEFRELFLNIMNSLAEYSQEWSSIVINYFKPKCRYLGYCPEKHSCGAMAMDDSKIKMTYDSLYLDHFPDFLNIDDGK